FPSVGRPAFPQHGETAWQYCVMNDSEVPAELPEQPASATSAATAAKVQVVKEPRTNIWTSAREHTRPSPRLQPGIRAVRAITFRGRSQALRESASEQICVARPARRDVAAVLDHEGGSVVGFGAALREHARASHELSAGVFERGFDLVLDVGVVGPIVAAELP